MSTVEERTAYLDNPFFEKHVYGDFTSFYITITICTVFGIFLFALNLICGCCSKHRVYWNDRFTGNRWIVALFTATAHKQPPLDLSELENVHIDYPNKYSVSNKTHLFGLISHDWLNCRASSSDSNTRHRRAHPRSLAALDPCQTRVLLSTPRSRTNQSEISTQRNSSSCRNAKAQSKPR